MKQRYAMVCPTDDILEKLPRGGSVVSPP